MDRQYNRAHSPSWFRSSEKKGLQALGRGRKGVGTKLHLALSATQVQGACLSAANKGYDYGIVRRSILEAGKTAVIPRKANAVVPGVRDPVRYKTRGAIERFFARLKENKRLVARFDKRDTMFFSFIALACFKILNLLC